MSADNLQAAAPAASTQDVLQLVQGDRRRIQALLADCRRLAEPEEASAADRSAVLARMGALMKAHLQLLQEFVYPALGAAPVAAAPLAAHEHLQRALATLLAPDEQGLQFGQRLRVLTEAAQAHAAALEQPLAGLRQGLQAENLQELGTRMALRRAQLLGDQGVD